MGSLYLLSVTVHVLAALLWLGGMFFLGVVGAPVLRGVEPSALRAELFRAIGERARLWGWISIGILVLTGLLNLHFRGMLSGDVWGSAAFWASPPGHALAWKLGAVAVMLVLSAVHDFVLGPRAGRAADATERARSRRQAALLARGNAVVGVLLVCWAVRLARGGG